jgi:hypothetical protein
MPKSALETGASPNSTMARNDASVRQLCCWLYSAVGLDVRFTFELLCELTSSPGRTDMKHLTTVFMVVKLVNIELTVRQVRCYNRRRFDLQAGQRAGPR